MSTFSEDVKTGLSSSPKYLSSKYFYDDKGSRIFQQIMEMPEYYLTDAEFEILSQQPAEIYQALGFDRHFNIVELGAGDGKKTLEFLRYLVDNQVDFTYMPIDISEEAINLLSADLRNKLPGLDIQPQLGDYFKILEKVVTQDAPNLFMFLGSNIGNYLPEAAEDLLRVIRGYMHPEDLLLIGFDLQKNPLTIAAAYNDAQGITREFNLNLLDRINRELGGDFDRKFFEFYSYYNPLNGEVRSFIVSLRDQGVKLEALNQEFSFTEGEWVYTELSRKYSLEEIHQLAAHCGFAVKKDFTDTRNYFTDSLWRVVS